MIHVAGMLGLGDNLHQRAIVRRLMQRAPVQLETPWPSVYLDLESGGRLRLVKRACGLRTQQKNAMREAARYKPAARGATRTVKVWYSHEEVRQRGTFLAAMAANCGVNASIDDIRLPIAQEWQARADYWRERWRPSRPLMLYRPLVERTEWKGCAARNPDPAAYARLARSIRERYFVVSIADLEPAKEWTVSEDIKPDVALHRGELELGALAALAAEPGALVFCSPGFAIILAQAVRSKLVAVFGGHEAPRFYDHGLRDNLLIGPEPACECFRKDHACSKRINFDAALPRLRAFTEEVNPCCTNRA